MKAMIIRAHGELDRLVYDERFPDPHPGPGEVVVAVRATSLNYHDVFTLRGMPGIKIPMPAIMGLDLAGEIAELGPGVEDWTVGDRVLVDPIDRVRGGLMGETIHEWNSPRARPLFSAQSWKASVGSDGSGKRVRVPAWSTNVGSRSRKTTWRLRSGRKRKSNCSIEAAKRKPAWRNRRWVSAAARAATSSSNSPPRKSA